MDPGLFFEITKNMVEGKARKGNTSNNENVTNVGDLRWSWDNVSRESDFEVSV